MNSEILTSFTIILSFIGIVISLASLIFSVVYLIKVIKLEKYTKILDKIKLILIKSCVGFGGNGEMILGDKIINAIMNKYHCDEYQAILLYYEGGLTLDLTKQLS